MTEQDVVEQNNKSSSGEENDYQKEQMTIVGIGASAGGLPALQSFFDSIPPDTGMAFVVVTHLHPERKSFMDEILQLRTAMPVRQVTAKVSVEPDHVYVIPPNYRIQMTDTHLVASEFDEPRGQRLPIDIFFRSLASAHRESVGIILSGGGTDGSVGIKAIKEQGGLLMAQRPDEAEFDSMPRAAIATGLVDAVLPVKELALKLIELQQQPVKLPQSVDQLSREDMEMVHRILAEVHTDTGHDFSQYKLTTILRRIQRRMQISSNSTFDSYLNFLRHDTDEAKAIFSDLLIGVTNFFRDQASWQVLADEIIPQLFKNKGPDDTVRTWTIGCATGEEAYTLAMLLVEHAATLKTSPKIQVFASDLDERSLVRAREGVYPAAIEADVSPERLRRFFIAEGDFYRIRQDMRNMVLFATHSVLRDPPFSRVDLISCRNLLIYLQREIQENVFEIFHYALNPEGYLFLGNSESAEMLPEVFHTLDKSHRIYQAKPWQGEHPHVPTLPLRVNRTDIPDLLIKNESRSLRRLANNALTLHRVHQEALEANSPPSILIDEEYNVLHVSETAGRYLLQPKGPLASNLVQLVRLELKQDLRSALFQAFEKNTAVVSFPIAVRFNGEPHRVIISVRPHLQEENQSGVKRRVGLVIFLEDETGWSEASTQAEEHTGSEEQVRNETVVKQLENEVRYLREQLQTALEEHENSSEEMKAANEELQSINEEYRSTTEELETSKEELQSVNEELQTVNLELKNNLEEISRAHSDLQNLMVATEIATLFLDRELCIQRYTPNMKAMFNIRESDRGRPIDHLTHKLVYDNLQADAHQVLRQLIPIEHEVRGQENEWFLLRIRPYRTVEDKIDGIVITLVEITQLKETEAALRQLNNTLEERIENRTRLLNETNQKLEQVNQLFLSLFHANPIPTCLTRLEDGTLLDVNEAYLRYFNYNRQDIIGRAPEELKQWLEPADQESLAERVRAEGRIRDLEIETGHPSGETRTILLSLQYLVSQDEETLITSFIDITERVRAEQQVKALVSQLTLAEQRERQRLSRILHNDLQQRLYAIQIQLALLRDGIIAGDSASIMEELSQLNDWLKEAIRMSRHLSIDLSPPLLEGEGLTQSISWLALQMQEQHNLTVTVQSKEELPHFDLSMRVLLFETVRELLFNIVKHANTSTGQIVLSQDDDYLTIVVSDEGQGFKPEMLTDLNHTKHLGHGLSTIRERLNLLGSQMTIKTAKDDGTQVTIKVPLPKSDE